MTGGAYKQGGLISGSLRYASKHSGKLRHGPPIYHSKSEGGDLSRNALAVEG